MPDLGTYHIKVEFENERGFIYQMTTGNRFTDGTKNISPINADLIKPAWESEKDIIDSSVFMWTEGSFSCDCNLRAFISEVYHEDGHDFDCGDELIINRLTLIRPDATELVIFEVGI